MEFVPRGCLNLIGFSSKCSEDGLPSTPNSKKIWSQGGNTVSPCGKECKITSRMSLPESSGNKEVSVSNFSEHSNNGRKNDKNLCKDEISLENDKVSIETDKGSDSCKS